MLVIVEGVDGSGKSTLIERLRSSLRGTVDVMHRGPPTRDPLMEYEDDLQSYHPGSGRHVLCDRWHWGESVYGPLLRGESRLGPAGWVHVELFLKARGALVVALAEPEERLRRRLAKRGDDLIHPAQLSVILNAYEQLTRMALVDVVEASSREFGLAERIIKMAGDLEARATHCGRYPTLIGTPRPRVLLLGERRADLRHASAFVPYPNTSGRFLLEALPDALLRECAIANAREEPIDQLWNDVGKPRVVSLGREASRACVDWGVPHTTVPHPQWTRRFHQGRQCEYGELIERATHEEAEWPSW